ncbi:hypothetical protein ACFQFC_24910 [Amorphoplanes digitatis]|uniref:Uncharacterized protein n=1 Tax=Actinoplanes digitatis TaxID=1868 RepID=A0A7W7MV99_9ACTN|nr:hypothetical protein [Actinoplanes digitatis]MBB4767464.1 hypothetical protein [Actinoplanes digitatis]GID97890.1 hypothetical protein Adi01nite_73020 [Actinoplanes digitatis]
MRGGLDDALDKLARRDELRRRAAGEVNGTPPSVTELVEAIAAVVGRYPELGVTVGVEGAGDPMLLHFAVEDGIVQVSADNSVADRVAEAAPTSPRHADFDIDAEDPEPYTPPYGYVFEQPAEQGHPSYPAADQGYDRYEEPGPRAQETFAPHPFAATPPPPVPPQTSRRVHAEQHRAPEEPVAARRGAQSVPEQRGMPAPLPEPIPLQVDTEEAQAAARRLAALLRDNPSLLRSQE